jgi:hypothetical protein
MLFGKGCSLGWGSPKRGSLERRVWSSRSDVGLGFEKRVNAECSFGTRGFWAVEDSSRQRVLCGEMLFAAEAAQLG